MSLRALPLLLAACTVRPLDFGESAGSTDTSTTGDTTTTGATTFPVTSAPTSTGTGTVVTTTTTSTTGEGSSTTDTRHPFLIEPDGGPGGIECDQWAEDCPEGQKCMPYSGDGDNAWESLKCVDIVPNPDGIGEPCTVVDSPVSGEDSCEKHAMCWDVDFETLTGTCVAMCTGSPDAPGCADPDANCAIAGDGVLALCFKECDPIVQDCSSGEVCLPVPQEPDRWLCVLDASGDEGQAFDPCEYVNACDPGLTCADPGLAVECDPMAMGCCLPFCDTDDPNTCPGEGQQCVPWYDDPADAASYNVDVGLCRLPMP